MNRIESKEIFTIPSSIAHEQIIGYKYPWQAIEKIPDIISKIIPTLGSEYEKIDEGVYVFKGVKIPNSVEISGRAIICEGAEMRHGAYLRGDVIIGRGCVVGNSCEIKSSILYDKACVPHFNYVGNSILGYGAHLGAGVILSNLKGNKSSAKVHLNGQILDTGLRKFGAVLGNYVEVGCGAVLNPATIVLSNTQIYPLSSVRGTIPESSIYKGDGKIIRKI